MEKENKGYLLQGKQLDKLIEVMDALKEEGYPTDNTVLAMVLQVMQDEGLIYGDTDVKGLIKKKIGDSGKILYMRGQDE